MNIFQLKYGLFGGGGRTIYAPTSIIENINAETETENLTTLITCIKILSDNFSRIPFYVKDKEGNIIENHRISNLWNIEPNSYTNSQTIRSNSEWKRNTHGNSFFVIHKDYLEEINSEEIRGWRLTGNKLEFEYMPISSLNIKHLRSHSYINSKDILHFKNVGGDGVFSLSPLTAAHATHQIMTNANRAMNNFYKNNAITPLAIERNFPTGGSFKDLAIDKELFKAEYQGVNNFFKPLHLALGEKAVPLSVKFADAELIQTMVFARDTITSLYNIPNWMLSSNDSTQNVEQQSKIFINTTMSNITNVYASELEYKLLTKQEKAKGYKVVADLDCLVDLTFAEKINTIGNAVSKGVMTPNEGIKKIGGKLIEGGWGDKHLTQAQYLILEDAGMFNPLLKDSPFIQKQLEDNILKDS